LKFIARHPPDIRFADHLTDSSGARTMKSISLSPAVAAAAAIIAVTAADAAYARTSYDGPWNVQIMTQRGECDSGVGFGVDIRDGTVRGYGGFDVSGRVANNGAVVVRISAGSSSASGSGRLAGSSGHGSWRGNGSRGACSGSWSASRR
jgi:hypothetical protein